VFSIGTKSHERGDYEEVVLVMELKEPLPSADIETYCESITAKVRAEVFKEHSLSLAFIVIVKPKTIPKTTSGKIQRSKTQRCFLSKTLEELYRKEFSEEVVDVVGAEDTPGTKTRSTPLFINMSPSQVRALDKKSIRAMLLDSISSIAGIDKSTVKDGSALSTYMDSVSLAQLKGLLEGQYGVKPFSDPYLFKDTTTLKKLVEVVKTGEAKDDDGHGPIDATQAAGGGSSPGCCGCVVM